MTFRLPELDYPLVIDTIGKTLAMGGELHVFCRSDGCTRNARVNLVTVAKRFGMDHGCMERDLKPLFFCQDCRDAGRQDRNMSFINVPPERYSIWPKA